MSMILVRHLSKVYRSEGGETVALKDVSFSIEKGEFVAIMGPSGSGKSTLMHILGALDIPSSGEYYLNNKKVSELGPNDLADVRNHQIGFIFQAYNLLPRTSTLKNVMLPMMYGDMPLAKRVPRATELLELVGLGHRLHHLSNQLSGGQQQRVAIARSLAMDPSILLADEPTGNIASDQANEIMEIFHQLHRRGHTIVMITHEPDIAAHAQRTLVIKDGRLVTDHSRKVGPPRRSPGGPKRPTPKRKKA
jgi:putative ABC transport system ATP-binding protein